MQKNAYWRYPKRLRYSHLVKITLAMRLTALLLISAIIQVHATSTAQTVTVTGENMPMSSVIKTIKKQTGYVAWGRLDLLKNSKLVSVSVEDMPLTEFLDLVLHQQPISYKIADKTIMFFKKSPAQPSSPSQRPRADTGPEPVRMPPITGTVTDDQGNPVPGINITIRGKNQGTNSGVDGSFSILVESGDVLIFSGIGYESQEITVTAFSPLRIRMKIAESKLDEIVVIGYGTQRKIDLTGSVGSVSAAELEKRPVTSVEQALSGTVAGVDVTLNSGRPGAAPRVRVRGSTSVSNTNDPLYVVDGVILNVERMQGSAHAISFIDPSNIASIDVLKDASATAIYGARGANGVVLITTKKGRKDGGRASYTVNLGLSSAARRVDLTNSREFLLIEDLAYQNAAKFDSAGFARGVYPDPAVKRRQFTEGNPLGNPVLFDDDLNPLYDTDWQDEAFRNAFTHQHNLSFAGGDQNTTYGIYLSYRDEEGVMRDSWLERYSARFVMDSKINDWLSVGGNLNFTNQKQKDLDGWALRGVFQNLPILPVKLPDGSWTPGEIYPGTEGTNSRQVAAEDKRIYNTNNLIGDIYANFRISSDLNLKSMIASNRTDQLAQRYAGRNLQRVSEAQQGIASLNNLLHQGWQFENILNYNKKIGSRHALNAMLGQSLQTFSRFVSASETQSFLDDYFEYNNLGAGANPRPSSSSAGRYKMLSYFGRLNYNLSSKYLFTVTGRVDGSSKFGNKNRYSFFPSMALGWLLSEEEFLKNSNTVSYLKIRSSYGVTGNSEIDNYQYEAGLGNYTAIFNNTRYVGTGISTLSNAALKWESNEQVDLGIELGLFDNRIRLETDLYYRKSNNMLLSRPVPRASGYSSVVENIGNMQNSGIEIALNTENIRNRDFRWNTGFNFSANRNKVLKLHGGADIIVGSAPGGSPGSIIREGWPVNTFVGYVRLGTWGEHEEAQAGRYNRRSGDIKYLDVNDDGIINSNDRVPLGNGVPDFYGSFINTFNYKGIELSIDIQYMHGNKVIWGTMVVLEDRTGAYNNMLRTVLDAWTPSNQNTMIAQNKPLGVGYDTNNDTHRIKDGSFIRGRNLSLSYSVPTESTGLRFVKGLRVFASAQNFFLITKFPGFDPEIASSTSDFLRGLSAYAEYPTPRTFLLGATIDF